MQKISSAAFSDTKPHYNLLDGLRGVAALLVVWFHVYEGFAFASGSDTIGGISHGYLAVDFFFMLSGFVIGYAYDNRWSQSLTLTEFFKRRLIRLHPMVLMGATLGAITFLLQGSVQWDGTPVPISMVLMALLCNIFFIPATGTRNEVRGNTEMFPLNGPCWSLFFEYIGNILYALFIRRLSTKHLGYLVGLTGVGLIAFATLNLSGYGNICVGWSMNTTHFTGGLLRMLFPFTMGLFLSRNFKPIKIKGAFWICTAILLALFAVPNIEGTAPICHNGLYEVFCIIVMFPIIIWLGASGTTTDTKSTRICNFLGNISFPLYIVHYPFMYLFYAWLIKNQLSTLEKTWPVVAGVYTLNVTVAYLCLKLYDEPVRKWLSNKFVAKKKMQKNKAK